MDELVLVHDSVVPAKEGAGCPGDEEVTLMVDLRWAVVEKGTNIINGPIYGTKEDADTWLAKVRTFTKSHDGDEVCRYERVDDLKAKVDRCISMWRRYKGRRVPDEGKLYDFDDLDELEIRLERLFKNPEAFDFNTGTVLETEED